MAKPKPFNNPFGGLKIKKEEAPKAKPPPARAQFKAPSKSKGSAGSPGSPRSIEEDEAALFLESVGEVAPVRAGPRVSAPPPPKIDPKRLVNEDAEVLTQLSELVAGEAPFDIVDSDEHVEGAISSLDPRLLQRLRKGEYAFHAHLDLHGMTREEAKVALERFVADARHRRIRCVLVVHGRGLHSKDQLPVLKQSVQAWLTRGRISKQVLAFTSARPTDGGVGAVYVLLRA